MGQRHQADVAIVGAGLAGLVTASQCLAAGRSVLLVDREPRARLGGAALEAFGGLFFADSPEQRRLGIRDSAEQAFADWERFGAFGPGEDRERAWARHLCERATPEARAWLRRIGVSFLPMVLWVERGGPGDAGPRGNSVPRFHLTWGTGRRIATQAAAELLERQRNGARLSLLCDHHVDGLDVVAGRVAGCHGTTSHGRDFHVEAGAVVIAAGGFGGDLERVRRFWQPAPGIAPPESMLIGTPPAADGRMLDHAAAAGAALRHRDRMWNYAAGVRHPQPGWTAHGVSLVPAKSALWCDATGARLMPPLVSGFDTHDLAARISAAPGGYGWQILNRTIALTELAASGADWNPALRDRRPVRFLLDMLGGQRWFWNALVMRSPDIATAPGVAALAAAMNGMGGDFRVAADTLAATIERFDATLETADPQRRAIEQLRGWRADRMRLARGIRILDPRQGPLVAIRTRIVTRKSLGGIVTDLSSRALDAQDQPVPGLFAAGEAAGFGGGGSHGQRALEGTFLLACILTARRAAEAISGR